MSPAHRTRSGFTLIEALVAISLTAIAGSTLLLGVTTSLKTTDDTMRETIAQGMAQQLMDEAVGCRYMELGDTAYATTLGPGVLETVAGARKRFDDIGDFNGFRSQPPTDSYGIALGTDDGQGGQRNAAFRCDAGYFQNWRQEIDVYYVADSDLTARLPSGTTSDYRVVEVRIVYVDPDRGDRELAKIRQVVPYVSPLSVK